MAKKKNSRNSKKGKSKNRSSPNRTSERRIKMPARLARELPKAHRLLAQARWQEASDMLASLDKKFPGQPDVLNELVNASYELQDYESYLRYIRPLYEIQPHLDTLGSLAVAYITNHYPFAALHYFEAFLSQYPEHEKAAAFAPTVAEIKEASAEALKEMDPNAEDNTELAFLHDMLRAASELIEVDRAREVGQALLEKYPDFVPALNNLSQIEHMAGNPDLAIEYSQRVLQREPDNFPAMGNLARYLYLAGQLDEATQVAARFKALSSDNPDIWMKKAETFTYLGDDQAVLDAAESAQSVEDINLLPQTPHLYHLGGVAAARMGKIEQAKSLWKQVLDLSPSLAIAKANLQDLAKKPGKQNGPWPFSAQQWLRSSYLTDMGNMLASGELGKNGPRPAAEALQPYLEENPHIIQLMAILLERGDEEARTIVIQLARFSEHPELLALVKVFALGQSGTDDQRQEALHAMTELNAIPSGNTKLWLKGEWTEIMTMGFEIGDESDFQHHIKNRTAQKKMERGTIMMQEGRDEEALKFLEEAYRLEPNNPGIINNLAGMRDRVRGEDNVRETLDRLTRDFPNYFFGHTGMANHYILEKEFEKAAAHLDPLLQRKKLHYSEFRSLAESFIRLSIGEGNPDVARSWLGMWQQVEPGHPNQDQYEFDIEMQTKVLAGRN